MNPLALVLFRMCLRMAAWQPPPYLGYDGHGEPVSWWFNRWYLGGGTVTNNRLGALWYRFWSRLAERFFRAAGRKEHR